jgi:hypothetical protein
MASGKKLGMKAVVVAMGLLTVLILLVVLLPIGYGPGPYVLDVHFRPGTSPQAASSLLNQCGHSSIVTRIDTPFVNNAGGLTAEVWTTSGSLGDPTTRSLLMCLNRSSLVVSVEPLRPL